MNVISGTKMSFSNKTTTDRWIITLLNGYDTIFIDVELCPWKLAIYIKYKISSLLSVKIMINNNTNNVLCKTRINYHIKNKFNILMRSCGI